LKVNVFSLYIAQNQLRFIPKGVILHMKNLPKQGDSGGPKGPERKGGEKKGGDVPGSV
jgi:hypothetical protein